MAKSKKADGGNGVATAEQVNPVIREIASKTPGVKLQLRADGQVTATFRRGGLAAKMISAFPVHWDIIAQVATAMMDDIKEDLKNNAG